MADSFEIKGADKLLRDLRQFTPKLQKKGLRNSARRAMVIVRDAARANARPIDDPQTPLNIAKEIIVQESARQSKAVGGVVMRVGVRGGARSSKDRRTPWYWRLVELGTQHSRARPFMRPALEQNVGAVTEKFTSELSKEIDKQVAAMRTGAG